MEAQRGGDAPWSEPWRAVPARGVVYPRQFCAENGTATARLTTLILTRFGTGPLRKPHSSRTDE